VKTRRRGGFGSPPKTSMDFTRFFLSPASFIDRPQVPAPKEGAPSPGGRDLPMDGTIIEYEQIRPKMRRKQ